MRPTTLRLVTALVAVGLGAAACSSTSDFEAPDAAPAEPTPAATDPPRVPTPEARDLPTPDEPTAPPSADYPPGDEAAIAAMINPLIADLGLRFSYGSLIDRTANATFEPSPTGDHFAVYVEPINDDYTDAEFIENTWVLAARLTPKLFGQYRGLASWDICQEPRPGENDEARPPPVTQLDIYRDGAEDIDWDNGSLADLIAAARDDESTTLRVEQQLQQLPEFVDELRQVE
jgi:hypothetical protein